MSKRNLFLGAVALLVGLAVLGWLARAFDARLAYHPPTHVTTDQDTPREQALRQQAAAEAETAKAKKYEEAEYRRFPGTGSRVAIWMVAQLHLLFAAFVLAVPLFALIIEYIGYRTKDPRYDALAYEFTKLLSTSFSLTATFGAALTFMLIALYPKFTNYLMSVFSPTFLPYVLLFFFEAGFLYSYYYGWHSFSKRVHLLLGVGLNLVGTAIMFIANAWLTFMMTPNGVSESGATISTWEAVRNYTWMPINIHRIIANVAFGGAVAAAYAAFQFLRAKTPEERAHYDWMGYIGNFVAICALLPLPFAGYWLASEIYAFSQTMGLIMMGGAFSWLFIIQAVLIGCLFLAANYYLWLGMGRIEGAERFRPFIKYLLALDHRLLHGVGDAALDHRHRRGSAEHGRRQPPAARLPRRHVGQEHGRQPAHPHHLRQLHALPAQRPRADGAVGEARQPHPVRRSSRPRRPSSSSSASTATSWKRRCASSSPSRRCCRCSSP